MLKKAAVVVLGIGVWGLGVAASAQEYWQPENRPLKAIGERLSEVGRTIFGDDRPAPPRRKPAASPTDNDVQPPRAGSARPAPAQRPPTVEVPGEPPSDPVYGGGYPQRNHQAIAAPQAAPADTMSPALDERIASSSGDVSGSSDSAGPSAPPLHERLKRFRGSAFGDTAASRPAPSEAPDSASQPVPERPTRPAERVAERPAGPVGSGAAIDSPRQTPTLARRPSGTSTAPTYQEPLPIAKKTAEPQPKWSSAGSGASAGAGLKARIERKADSDVLFARKSPMLSVESQGPRRITVGKEAAYEIILQNAGEVAADDVTVFVTLPEWTEVAGTDASTGSVRAAPQGSSEPFQWSVGRIEAKSREKLVMRIVPKQSRPFELAVRYDYKPSLSQATIEVQEPKLAMRLEGPREVFFGKREVFKLKLSNTGNGAAENVALALTAVGTGDGQPISHRLGTLPAGEERTIEVELTARQAGNLAIQVEARADGSVRAELAEKVFVRRAGLEMEADGPAVQYVGTAANYRIRVRNPGNAPARNVQVAVVLPAGVKYVAGTEGAKVAAAGTKVQWTLDSLEPAGERTLMLKCSMSVSGSSRLDVAAAADDELTASAVAVTRVDALADLRLEVKDPEGPLPIGEEASYELRVRNRGTKTAENVEVLTYFSTGIEPTGAEGHPHRLNPGQVAFSPIPSLAPGAEVKLKVRARADAAGNHIFRAEVHCKALGARLVREETTHFYQDAPLQATRSSSSPGNSGSVPDAPRRPSSPPREQSEPSALPRVPGEPGPAPLMR